MAKAEQQKNATALDRAKFVADSTLKAQEEDLRLKALIEKEVAKEEVMFEKQKRLQEREQEQIKLNIEQEKQKGELQTLTAEQRKKELEEQKKRLQEEQRAKLNDILQKNKKFIDVCPSGG